MTSPSPHLARLGDRAVFSVGEECFTWADVVLAAIRHGDWAEQSTRTRHGLAALRRVTAAGEEVPAARITAAAKRFRYERELLAADELDAWLDRFGLSHADWHDCLSRELLRSRSHGAAAASAICDAEVLACVGVDAICGGLLESTAHRLGAHAALAVDVPDERILPDQHADDATHAATAAQALGGTIAEWEERLRRIGHIEARASDARARLVDQPAVEHAVAEHRLDWLGLELDVLDFSREPAAREAALCVRADDLDLAVVAERSGARLTRRSLRLAEAEPWLAPHLFGATEGGLIGPLAHDSGFTVARVVSRRPPDPADPHIRRRAEAELVRRAATGHLADHVRWHEPCHVGRTEQPR